jgi:ABC-type phosphate/phosphonate transport system substrate-binding protein
MYDWSEAREETDREWIVIRDALRAQGIDAPDQLVRTNADLPPVPEETRGKNDSAVASFTAGLPSDDLDLMKIWQHPLLLFGQTCWGPMEQGLERQVVVVGQPNYSRYEGGEGEQYSSAILTSRGELGNRSIDTMEDTLKFISGKRFAFNSPDSMSGLLALERDFRLFNKSLDVFSERVETGGHRASIRAVAEGKADVCAIDCRTWDLAKRFEPAANMLEVVGWTSKRKGLPYITSRHRTASEVKKIKQAMLKLDLFSAS